MIARGSRRLQLSLNNGHLDRKASKIKAFRSLFLLCDTNMTLKKSGSYFYYTHHKETGFCRSGYCVENSSS